MDAIYYSHVLLPVTSTPSTNHDAPRHLIDSFSGLCLHPAPSTTPPAISLAPSLYILCLHPAPTTTPRTISLAPLYILLSLHPAPTTTPPAISLAPSLYILLRGQKRLSNVLAAGGQAQCMAAADASRRAEIQGMPNIIFITLLSTMTLRV
jgi:hypothetical protein